MRDSKNMAKGSGRKTYINGRPNPKPQGVTGGKRSVQNIDVPHRSQKYVQGITHNGPSKYHTAILDIGYQQSTIGMGVW